MKALITLLILLLSNSGTSTGNDCDDWTLSDMKSKVKSEMWGALRCHSANTILDVDIDDVDINGKRYDFKGTYKGKKEGAKYSYPGKIEGQFVLEYSGWSGCKLVIKKARYTRGGISGSLVGCY